jgi:3-phenylpropionate/cinnamic acid dioxygenase small subunit
MVIDFSGKMFPSMVPDTSMVSPALARESAWATLAQGATDVQEDPDPDWDTYQVLPAAPAGMAPTSAPPTAASRPRTAIGAARPGQVGSPVERLLCRAFAPRLATGLILRIEFPPHRVERRGQTVPRGQPRSADPGTPVGGVLHVVCRGNRGNLAVMDTQGIDPVDRVGMDDLLTRYATAIDTRDWELLDTVFTDEAHLDYRSAGGVEGTYPEVRQWLADVLPIFEMTQHLVVNREFGRSKDGADARSCFLNINRLEVEGKPWLFTVGGRYHDRLVDTSDGWRIAERIEHTLWWDNPMPGLPEVPYRAP